MTHPTLRAQPSSLQSVATALRRLEATEFGACLADLQRARQALDSHWSGEAATAFDRQFAGWFERFRARGRGILATAQYLERVIAGYAENETRLSTQTAFDQSALKGGAVGGGASKVHGRPAALDADGTIGLVDLAWYAQVCYGSAWPQYLKAWQADVPFMRAMDLLKENYSIQVGNDIYHRVYVRRSTNGTIWFSDAAGNPVLLTDLAGKGPYKILDENSRLIADPVSNYGGSGGWLSTGAWEGYQPVYDYGTGSPVFTGEWRAYAPFGTNIQVTPLDVALLGGSFGATTVTKGSRTVMEVTAAQLIKVLGPRAAALLPAATLAAPVATVVVLAATVDSTGTIYLDGYSETLLADGFWNEPAWEQPAPQPGRPPVTGAQPAPWANPNGPSYPAVPGSPIHP